MSYTVCLLPGDGIGPEVAEASRTVIDALKVGISWIILPAGAGAVEEFGKVLPEHTVDAIRRYRVALKAPITTPIGKGFSSVNVELRNKTTGLTPAPGTVAEPPQALIVLVQLPNAPRATPVRAADAPPSPSPPTARPAAP